MFEEVKKKIMAGADATKLGTGETSAVELTQEERAYILGGLNISHNLILDIKEGEPVAMEWFENIRPARHKVR